MKPDDRMGKHVLDPSNTEAVHLDKYDRYAIQEALLEHAEEHPDEEWEEYFESLANYVIPR